MCPSYRHSMRSQRGFLVPLSMFIVVGAATLAIAMSQMAAGSRSSAVLSTLNAQAFYAADSGIQRALHQLYYGNNTQSAVDTACNAVNGSSFNLAVTGLNGCSVSLSCEVTQSADASISVYSVLSQSACGQGDYSTGRRIRTQAYMFDN